MHIAIAHRVGGTDCEKVGGTVGVIFFAALIRWVAPIAWIRGSIGWVAPNAWIQSVGGTD